MYELSAFLQFALKHKQSICVSGDTFKLHWLCYFYVRMERERDVEGVGWSPLLLRALRVHLFVTLAECAVTVIWQVKAASTGLEQTRVL